MKVGGLEGVITPAFQPIVHVVSGRPLYFEALARSTRARDHRDLLAFAEGYGFIQLVDAAMLQAVALVLARNPGVRIGVNVSVDTIERFCGQLVSGIFEHLDVVGRLVVEVTETIPIQNPAALQTFIGAARSAGVGIAFDDFGAGHFTLDHIRRFEPDIVKLSQELIEARSARRADLEQVIELADRQGFSLVAEAIDCEIKRSDCIAMGIDYAQGFLVGPLVAEREIAQLASEPQLRLVASAS